MIRNILTILTFLALFNFTSIAQIKIIELPSGFDKLQDSLFLGTTISRSVQSLNKGWKAFYEDKPEAYTEVSFPLKIDTKKTIVFEKSFSISPEKIHNNFIQLHFLGLNYYAEIFVNNASIYKHPGGAIPFTLDIPSDILNYDSENKLRIKLQYAIDSKNTIPLSQQFIFPKSFGGVFRDIYLSFRPKVGIKDAEITFQKEKKPYQGKFSFLVNLEKFNKSVSDSLLQNFHGFFKLSASLKIIGDTTNKYFNIWNIKPIKTNNFQKSFFVKLKRISFWNNLNPKTYLLSVKLTNEDGFVYDEYKKKFSLYSFKKEKDKLFLNNKEFKIEGVTYIRSNEKSISNYNQIKNDLLKIKALGFNTVRFAKTIPHPYAVYLCEQLGMFSTLELPLNSIPERFAIDKDFQTRSVTFINRTIKFFNKYPTIIAYGTGGGFLNNSKEHNNFINLIAGTIRKNAPGKLVYSSFSNLPKLVPNIDMYGLELYSFNFEKIKNNFVNKSGQDSLIYFISEATYPTFKGGADGYLNEFSFEGQAKFFEDVIKFNDDIKLDGFILNSMFDYTGNYAPFYTGFNENNLYNIGILPNDSSASRISYNLIKSKLLGGPRVSVPIGSKTNDSNFFFVIAALVISSIIAMLINSKRKFREDAQRALIRPYNFYADIRDQRILSGFHSNILMILLAGSNALLITILLHYLKNNILLEKFVLAFGSYKLSEIVGYFAWHPLYAFAYLFVISILLFIIISFTIHLFSFFVKTRVLFSSIYFTAIWAFLPLALLLPIEAALYKVLQLNSFHKYIYIFLFLFLIWIIQRLIKGIFVIFDVRPIYVYLVSTAFLLLVGIGIVTYIQYTSFALDYIMIAFKQYF